MEVKFQPGAKLFLARKPRKTPIYWADKVTKVGEKLIKAGIIKKVTAIKQAELMSPASFVAKEEK